MFALTSSTLLQSHSKINTRLSRMILRVWNVNKQDSKDPFNKINFTKIKNNIFHFVFSVTLLCFKSDV